MGGFLPAITFGQPQDHATSSQPTVESACRGGHRGLQGARNATAAGRAGHFPETALTGASAAVARLLRMTGLRYVTGVPVR